MTILNGTALRSAALASGTLVLGFTLGIQAGGRAQTTDDKPVQVASVNHISVFVKSVEKTVEMHRLLLGTEVPKIQEPPVQPIFPPEFTGDRNSRPRYGTVQLQNARIEIMEPVGGESRWRGFLAEHGQGIEHLGFAVPDVKAAKERFLKAGGRLIMGGCDTCATAHIDMRDSLGYIVELMPAPKQ